MEQNNSYDAATGRYEWKLESDTINDVDVDIVMLPIAYGENIHTGIPVD